ncbi:MAG: nucleotidyltransferase [Gammaproteobacteria bacterium]|nr:nucleotidyltransferase [Gammaproteobacteria bacterium]
MKVIILSAGQGRRLLPLTAGMPKCGVEICGRSLLEWQLREIAQCDVEEVVVVSGFHAEYVDELVDRMDMVPVRTLHNPFYDASDNLGTCWVARHEMQGDFIILNGDTLFESGIMQKLLASEVDAPITLVTDRKGDYDEDDMKVVVEGNRLQRVGKQLALDTVNGESIGMMVFRDGGPELFVRTIEGLMRTDRGLKMWYLSAIDGLAQEGQVSTCDIHGLSWCEIDDRGDLDNAANVVSAWNGGEDS